MKTRMVVLSVSVCVLLGISNKVSAATVNATERAEITANMATVQIPFIANTGQVDEQVAFIAKTFGGTVFVTHTGELVYALPKNGQEQTEIGAFLPPIESTGTTGVVLREQLVNGTVQQVTGAAQAVTRVSSFKGNDPAQWQRNIPTYQQLDLGEVYPGIALSLTAHGNNVEKIFTVQPGISPEMIRLKIEGGQTVRVNAAGELAVTTELGEVTFTKPVAYQERAGQRAVVDVAYIVDGQEYGFAVGAYDQTQPLVIDPLLASTFIGGSGNDSSSGIALDSSGNVYIVGQTGSTDFPATPGAYDLTSSAASWNNDLVIVKLNSSLTTLLAATYLGGSLTESGYGRSDILIDANGDVYIGTATASADFPTTPGAYDQTYNGGFIDQFHGGDWVIVKMDSSLSTLRASTYLGGSQGEHFRKFVFGKNNDIYMVGDTLSTDFPTTPGAYDRTYNGGDNYWAGDIIIARMDTALTTLLAATYLGGSWRDYSYRGSLALDQNGDVYVGGQTGSTDFPTTPGAYDRTYNGGDGVWEGGDMVIAHLDAALTTLLASTYLGGTGFDGLTGVTCDHNGNVYIAGHTGSSDFPTTPGAYDETYNGGAMDGMIAMMNSSLTRLLAATYLGGSGLDSTGDLILDNNGDVLLGGNSESPNFPTTPGAYDETFNGARDSVLARLNSTLTTLRAATYIGGSGLDAFQVMTFDGNGNLIFTNQVQSADFPTTSGAYDTTYNGGDDIVVVKINPELSATSPIPPIPTPRPGDDPSPIPNPSPVPEPGTLLLFGAGLVSLLTLARKRLGQKR